MDGNLILDVVDANQDVEMETSEIISCRSCLAELLESSDVKWNNISDIGWKSLTFKQMFEISLGYQIKSSEPQNFCDSCARTLIEWHEFKSLCQKTQESLNEIPVKQDPDEEIHEETVWCANNLKVESGKLSSAVKIEPNEIFFSEIPPPRNVKRPTTKFTLILRNYAQQMLKHCELLGELSFGEVNSREILHAIWLQIVPHLKRQIIFDSKDNSPKWHAVETPQERYIDRYVLFQEKIARKNVSSVTFLADEYVWRGMDVTVFVFPYSRAIMTRLQWQLAFASLIQPANPEDAEKLLNIYKAKVRTARVEKLIEAKKVVVTPKKVEKPKQKVEKPQKPSIFTPPPEPLLIFVPNDVTEFKFVVTFETFVRQFRNQKNKVYLGKFTIAGNTVEGFAHNLWIGVKSYLLREISLGVDGEPHWSSQKFPHEIDLERFTEFFDKIAKRTYVLPEFKEPLLDVWQKREIGLNIYPYSKSISGEKIWRKIQQLICVPVASKIVVEGKKHEFVPNDEEKFINDLMNSLRVVHEQEFPNVTDIHWRTWAHYVNCFPKTTHEKLINERPPTQLLPFFDFNLDLFPQKPPLETTDRSIKLLVRLKLTRYNASRNDISLGKLSFRANTVSDIKNSIWETIRPFLGREVIIQSGDLPPMWSPKTTPFESDVNEFVTIKDMKSKRMFSVNCINEKLLEAWKKKKGLILIVYHFSKSIFNQMQYHEFKSTLMEPKTESLKETKKIIDELKENHQLVSLETNWRMWAHYVQAHDMSEHERVMRENPPKELANLFLSKELQELTVTEDEETENEEKAPKNLITPALAYEILKLTPEDLADRDKYKQCPYEGCGSVFKIKYITNHMNSCKFNLERKNLFRCKFVGCKRAYSTRSLVGRHFRRCRFNPNRKISPLVECPQCSLKTRSLKSHILFKHSDNKRHVCYICGATKSSKYAISNHIKVVHNNEKFQCDKCGQEYKTKYALQVHDKRVHSDKPQELEFNLKCDHCSYKTHLRENLKRHLKLNHDPTFQRPVCPQCNKVLMTQRSMRDHMLTHADTEFACDVCSHVCKTEKALKSHKTLHEEWQYDCPVCKMKRRSAYEVRMHLIRKHPGYKMPRKGTILKTTSKNHGKIAMYYPSDDEENGDGDSQ